MKRNMKIFLIATVLSLSVRTAIFLKSDDPFPNFDAQEYYRNSKDLSVWNMATYRIGYTDWWQRTPAYTLYLHITNRNIPFQMVVSSAGVGLMAVIHPVAGILWGTYIPDIVGSTEYSKQPIYCFLVILVLFFHRKAKRRWTILPLFLLISLMFGSFGPVIDANYALHQKPMQNLWEMYKPAFGRETWYMFAYIAIYVLIVFTFVRYTHIFTVEWAVVIIHTAVYVSIYANSSMRAPLIPIMINAIIASSFWEVYREAEEYADREVPYHLRHS